MRNLKESHAEGFGRPLDAAGAMPNIDYRKYSRHIVGLEREG
jgi:hypothetical protein